MFYAKKSWRNSPKGMSGRSKEPWAGPTGCPRTVCGHRLCGLLFGCPDGPSPPGPSPWVCPRRPVWPPLSTTYCRLGPQEHEGGGVVLLGAGSASCRQAAQGLGRRRQRQVPPRPRWLRAPMPAAPRLPHRPPGFPAGGRLLPRPRTALGRPSPSVPISALFISYEFSYVNRGGPVQGEPPPHLSPLEPPSACPAAGPVPGQRLLGIRAREARHL